MKLKSIRESVAHAAPKPSLAACALEDCPSPTDRVRTIHGHRLCFQCHWELLIALTPDDPRDPEWQVLRKGSKWRELLQATPEQVSKFVATWRAN